MSDTITGAIIGVGGAIVGALIAVLVGYYFSINIMRRQEFNKAAAVFRSAFTNEIRMLREDYSVYEPSAKLTYQMLTSAAVRHENAYIRFRPYFTNSDRVGIDTAWKEYLYPNGYNKKADFPLLDYEGGDETQKRKLAHDKISALLKFTEVA